MPNSDSVPVAMIVAMAQNRVIGVDNQLPWYLPEDLKHFKAKTQGKPMIMGRKTFESIGRALPGRLNIVVTRDSAFMHDGIRVCHNLADALELAENQAFIDQAEEVIIMGGGEIYRQAMAQANKLYITEVKLSIKGDAYFPEIDHNEWQENLRIAGDSKEGQPAYDFVEYLRKA